jgi:hypothetical protein
MLLTAFIVLQVILDIEVAVYFLLKMRRRRKAAARPVAPPPEPPAWYRDFLVLAEDLLTLIEPVLAHLETHPATATTASGTAASPAPAGAASSGPAAAAAARPPEPRSLRERHRAAFALLRAGASPEDVARREGLGAGELRLIQGLAAAEAENRSAPAP